MNKELISAFGKDLSRRLVCPVDVHVARVARRFGLLTRKPVDWLAAWS